jgi:methionyl-tRNA formyltransferase
VPRLVFLGTPEEAVAPLRTLVAAGHEIALVVTRPDTRRGRGGASVPSPVKTAALELGLEVTSTIGEVVDRGAELGVVVAFGRIIPAAVLEQLPMVNVHFSLLPRWRGAAPVERAILEGDAETGVCLMEVATGLDTGAVYASVSTPIGDEEDAASLRSRLVCLACGLLEDHLAEGRAGLPRPRDQAGTPSYAEKIDPAELELDWEEPALRIRRVVRLGRAWTTFRGQRLRVLEAAHDDHGSAPTSAALAPGTLEGELVAAGDGGRVRLVTVQSAGGRPMAASDWLRGVRLETGERLG